MNVVDLEILIPASPDFIWRFLGNLEKSVDWQEGVRSISFLTSQHEGKGTRWRYATDRGNDVIMEIGAWYDSVGYEYSVVDGARFGENQGRIRLQEVTDGTLIRWTFNYELSGVLGGLRNAMRHKRGTTKQIQDSLRNLHKLVQKESGGISTHQARSNVREAPDANERSSYSPRHPSGYVDPATDTEKMLEQDMPMPLMFEYEQASASPPSVPETDTKPNPVVQAGDIAAEVESLDTKVEEATQPIDMEIISYEPLDIPKHQEPETEPEEIQEPVPEASSVSIEPATREPRALDTSAVSVFEIFGLRKPSEAGGQLQEDESAADRAALRYSLDVTASPRLDDRFSSLDKLQNSGSSDVDISGRRDQLPGVGRSDTPDSPESQITGWRRKRRRLQHPLRSHNI